MSTGNRVASKDGTSIAYTRHGNGPAIVLVGGGLDDASENAPLATELSRRFTVYNYARRGRGESGDTPPYALEREIEDLDAVIANAGQAVYLYGVSSGGALALEAAAAGVSPIEKIAVYEVPYNMAADWSWRWRAYVSELTILLASGRRDDALARFMRLTGTSEQQIEQAMNSPSWPAGVALAHTLSYDAAALGDGRPPARLSHITQPTLVATGSHARSSEGAEWVLALDRAAGAIASLISRSERETLEGQSHVADPIAVASSLERFFGG